MTLRNIQIILSSDLRGVLLRDAEAGLPTMPLLGFNVNVWLLDTGDITAHLSAFSGTQRAVARLLDDPLQRLHDGCVDERSEQPRRWGAYILTPLPKEGGMTVIRLRLNERRACVINLSVLTGVSYLDAQTHLANCGYTLVSPGDVPTCIALDGTQWPYDALTTVQLMLHNEAQIRATVKGGADAG